MLLWGWVQRRVLRFFRGILFKIAFFSIIPEIIAKILLTKSIGWCIIYVYVCNYLIKGYFYKKKGRYNGNYQIYLRNLFVKRIEKN